MGIWADREISCGNEPRERSRSTRCRQSSERRPFSHRGGWLNEIKVGRTACPEGLLEVERELNASLPSTEKPPRNWPLVRREEERVKLILTLPIWSSGLHLAHPLP